MGTMYETLYICRSRVRTLNTKDENMATWNNNFMVVVKNSGFQNFPLPELLEKGTRN